MEKSELIRHLMSAFLEELHEHVGQMNRDLLALEKKPSRDQWNELVKSLFRAAHTIKGASRAVSVDVIESACHLVEDMLSDVRDEKRTLTPELFTLLFNTVDAIEEAGMRLREEQDLTDASLHALLPQLEAANAGKVSDERSTQPPTELASAPRMLPVSLPTEPWNMPPPEDIEARNQSAETTRELVRQVEPSKPLTPTSSPAASLSVRVAADKLDALLAQNGELLVARRRVESRNADVVSLSELVADWKAEWKSIEKPIRRLMAEQRDGAAPSRLSVLPRRAAALLGQTTERLVQVEKELDRLSTKMTADSRLLSQVCGSLDDEVHRVRMLPFAEACGGLERAVRDVARRCGKEVQLVIEGEDVDVDRSVLEGLKDPMLHLVRNAVDHGIEPPDQRQASGKPRQAKITVSAALRGGQVEVVVADDGKGFDLEKIRAKLREKEIAEPDNERDLARVVFLPGFSTASKITDVSGRGVGLDVVQSQIESLHGAVDVSIRSGEGTHFIMTVPLTLTTIRSVMITSAGQTYAIPTTHVQQLVRFAADDVVSVGGRDALLLGAAPIPLTTLADTLGFAAGRTNHRNGKLLAMVLVAGEQIAAFVVDDVISEQEVTVKNLGARVRRVRHVAGATLLPSGRIALVLNVANLIRTGLGIKPSPVFLPQECPADSAAKKSVLVVDDSITTRMLLKSILEAAGYETEVARDGQHALEVLEDRHFDLVVSDVDMPRLHGFALTEAIRNQDRWAGLPVVLVTARGSEEDKSRGIEVGADGYIVKSGFEQTNLLETISQLL